MMFHIAIDEEQAVGIGNENAELVFLFTEHTSQEVGESVCRFLNKAEENLYLVCVRHDPDRDLWMVDDDSRHHLDGTHDLFELRVAAIKPLVKQPGIGCPFCGHRYYYVEEKAAGRLREFGCGCEESLKGVVE